LIAAFVAVIFAVVAAVFIYIGTRPQADERARIVFGGFDAYVYGEDNISLKNENVKIKFYLTEGYFRHVGDPEKGLEVEIDSSRRGWGPFIAGVKGKTDYSGGYIENNGTWQVQEAGDNRGIRWLLHVPVTIDGRFEEGMEGYLYLWTDNNITSNVDNAKVDPAEFVFWDELDDLPIIVKCYDDLIYSDWGPPRLFKAKDSQDC
jgi:hypothetical protein